MKRRFPLVLLLLAVEWARAQVVLGGSKEAELPVWSTTQTQPNRYIAAHGLRGFAGGYSEDGLEFWSFPLQIVSGYRLIFDTPREEPLAGLDVLTSVEVDPLGVTRVYTATNFQVRERIATHAGDPGVFVSFKVTGTADLRIRAQFRPSLNLMWPAGFGGQEVGWDEKAKGFLLGEPTHRFRALVASPEGEGHTEPNNDRRNSAFDRSIEIALHPRPCGQERCATLVFAGQSEAQEEVHTTAAALLRAASTADGADAERFRPDRLMGVTTPDPEVNRAIRWAQIAVEQAWTCNPRLGCGTVAGYGPSHGSRRPQYAWYFAGDGLVATDAFLREGDLQRASAELAFIFRYQNPENGMVWHELSQSAGFLQWARDYPYMYVHVDITFDLLKVLARYVKVSGDREFLRQHWAATQRAYAYCRSTLNAKDGLPRVPADKLSSDEQDRLTDALTLSASWAEAAHAMAELANPMQDSRLALEAEAESQRARRSIIQRYWQPNEQRWASGFTSAGAATESTTAGDLAAISSGAATEEQTAAIAKTLVTPPYLTAWGLRGTPSTSPEYTPTAYSKGSVLALETSGAADLLWNTHQAQAAERLWQTLIPWASADSLGHMHELMSGSFFVPQRESVPEQTWSSAGFLSATLHGLLGIDTDANKRDLVFAPQVPSSWKLLQIDRVPVGRSLVSLKRHAEDGRCVLDVQNAGPTIHLRWTEATCGGEKQTLTERDVLPGQTHITIP